MPLRLTSPQAQAARQPSPQQLQQQQMHAPGVQQNVVVGGNVRMMGHPGGAVMTRPMQQQQMHVQQQPQFAKQMPQHPHQQMQPQQIGGQVMMQRPVGHMQQQQQHMVCYRANFVNELINLIVFFCQGMQQQQQQQMEQMMQQQQRFVRPANVQQHQQQPGEQVRMIRHGFPMTSALQHQLLLNFSNNSRTTCNLVPWLCNNKVVR